MNNKTKPRHFLSLLDLSSDELNKLIQRAIELKKAHYDGNGELSLKGKVLGMIFEKSSTRTRISFEAGMHQLGGHALFLSSKDTQLGRGEPIADAAKVMSRMLDCIMIRTFDQKTVETFAENSRIPIINALTDMYHPCQLLADVQTYVEHRGSIQGKTITWVGDGNNMCHSYINAARRFDFNLNIACPEGYDPDADILAAAGDRCQVFRDPKDAVKNSDMVVTDVWASMGQEEEQKLREVAFAGFEVTTELMSLANNDALFLHCLPAHRGEEVAADVIDHPDSVVWDEAENRLHAQKALLEFLLLD